MNNEQIVESVKLRCFEIVESIINGGGEEQGIGESLTRDMSMTTATECYWGTSGRGNPNAKDKIRIAGRLGFLRVWRLGRNERVGLSEGGLKLYQELKTEAVN